MERERLYVPFPVIPFLYGWIPLLKRNNFLIPFENVLNFSVKSALEYFALHAACQSRHEVVFDFHHQGGQVFDSLIAPALSVQCNLKTILRELCAKRYPCYVSLPDVIFSPLQIPAFAHYPSAPFRFLPRSLLRSLLWFFSTTKQLMHSTILQQRHFAICSGLSWMYPSTFFSMFFLIFQRRSLFPLQT